MIKFDHFLSFFSLYIIYVYRKLSELGYHRSAKKCKEKFENVYKYHKRTKEGRSGKHEGKTYKFFDQLQALENQFTVSSYSPKPQPTLATATTTTNTITLPPPTRPSAITPISYVTTTVPSTNPTIISPSPPQPPTNATTTTTITYKKRLKVYIYLYPHSLSYQETSFTKFLFNAIPAFASKILDLEQ